MKLIIYLIFSDKTPPKKKKKTTTNSNQQVLEAPLVEAPTEFNRREWPEIQEAFEELSEAIDGLKVPIDDVEIEGILLLS